VLCDRDDEPQVRGHHLLFRRRVPALDPHRELDLLRSRQQRHLADVLEEELQGVRRDLVGPGDEVELGVVDIPLVDVRLRDVLVELFELVPVRTPVEIVAGAPASPAL